MRASGAVKYQLNRHASRRPKSAAEHLLGEPPVAQHRARVADSTGGVPWPVEGRRADPRAIRQLEDSYCGCACALMLMQMLGIKPLPTQDELSRLGEGMYFSVESLREALNELCAHTEYANTWRGGWVADPGTSAEQWSMARRLSTPGPWIANFWLPREPVGHFLVVTGVDQERLEILDPRPGECYWMSRSDFSSYWNGQAVFSFRRTV
jgi:ABC-type bacteriocin/lantibiotic exporter with double-glycine peptidase domain